MRSPLSHFGERIAYGVCNPLFTVKVLHRIEDLNHICVSCVHFDSQIVHFGEKHPVT